jgi:carbamoyltransferase
MLVLGIHDGKDPSVVLMRDGAIRRVGFEADYVDDPFEVTGFPAGALEQLMAVEGIRGDDVDVVAFAGQHLPEPRTRRELLKQFAESGTFRASAKKLLRTAVPFGSRRPSRRDRLRNLEKLGLKPDRSIFIDHHLAQAAAAAASTHGADGRLLVLCCEGTGDGIAASVHVSRGGRLDRVATISEDNSIGSFIETLTYLLGMVPERDEGLLMELGGLARGPQLSKVTKRLSILFEFDPLLPLNWRRTGNLPETYESVEFLRAHLRRRRFDHIAGAARQFLEQFLAQWIDRCVLKTACDSVVLTGSVFGLRSLYPALAGATRTAQLSISPAPTDAGNAVGAAIMALAEKQGVEHVLPLGHPWLGEDAGEGDCAEFARQEESRGGVWVDQPEDIEVRAAELVAGGALLGRIAGRVDLSRVGLGNRSLLARGDLPELRAAMLQLYRPDVFWHEVPTLVLGSELEADFDGTGKLPPGSFGEYWLKPRRPQAWTGRMNPVATTPVQIADERSDPSTAGIVKAFRKAAGRTPLLCAPWLNRRGQLIRTVQDAKESWRAQGLDGVIAGPYLVLRRADPSATKPKHAELARRAFYGGL